MADGHPPGSPDRSVPPHQQPTGTVTPQQRAAILTAAEHEAAAIAAAAQQEVRRILIRARQDLIVLAAQVAAATGESGTRAQDSGIDPRRRVLDEAARTALGPRAIEDAPESLEALAAEVARLANTGAGADTTLRHGHSAGGGRSHRIAGLGLRGLVAGGTVVVVLLLLGVTWWVGSAFEPPRPAGTTAEPIATSAPATPLAPEPVPPTAAMPAPPAAPPAPALRLDARGEVWVQTTLDGRTDGGQTLQAGDSRTIPDARSVVLRVGDAGALWVSVDGGEPAPLGGEGQVVTREFAWDITPGGR